MSKLAQTSITTEPTTEASIEEISSVQQNGNVVETTLTTTDKLTGEERTETYSFAINNNSAVMTAGVFAAMLEALGYGDAIECLNDVYGMDVTLL